MSELIHGYSGKRRGQVKRLCDDEWGDKPLDTPRGKSNWSNSMEKITCLECLRLTIHKWEQIIAKAKERFEQGRDTVVERQAREREDTAPEPTV